MSHSKPSPNGGLNKKGWIESFSVNLVQKCCFISNMPHYQSCHTSQSDDSPARAPPAGQSWHYTWRWGAAPLGPFIYPWSHPSYLPPTASYIVLNLMHNVQLLLWAHFILKAENWQIPSKSKYPQKWILLMCSFEFDEEIWRWGAAQGGVCSYSSALFSW